MPLAISSLCLRGDLIQIVAHLKDGQSFGLTEFIRVLKYFLIQSTIKYDGNAGKGENKQRKIKGEAGRGKASLCHRPEFKQQVYIIQNTELRIIFTDTVYLTNFETPVEIIFCASGWFTVVTRLRRCTGMENLLNIQNRKEMGNHIIVTAKEPL